MNREEALRRVREGGRARPPHWASGYVYAKNESIVNEAGFTSRDDALLFRNAAWATGWKMLRDPEWVRELRRELAAAEERAEVAEKESAERHDRFVAANQGWTHAEGQRDHAYKRIEGLQKENTRLTSELAEAKAQAPRFKVGELTGAEVDALHALFKYGPLEDGDVPSKSGRDGLCERGYAVRITVKGNDGYQALTQAGHEAFSERRQAIAAKFVPEWHPCSASEAREKHAAGKRVREADNRWGGGWLAFGIAYAESGKQIESACTEARLRVLALAPGLVGAHGWQWSEPLPETEGGAK